MCINYLKKYKIQEIFTDLLNSIIEIRPENPLIYSINYLVELLPLELLEKVKITFDSNEKLKKSLAIRR